MSPPNRQQSWMRYRSAAPHTGEHQRHRYEQGYWQALLLGILLLLATPLWSQPSQPVAPGAPLTDADQVLGFADALFQDGDYYRAITEYKRFLFLHPLDARAGRIQLQIGLSYLRGQQWEDARQTFATIAQQHPDAAIRGEAAFLIGETAYQQGRYTQAIEALRPVAERYAQTPVGEKARYRLGWSYLHARQWPQASDAFAAIDTTSPLFPSARLLADASREAEQLPRKSPALAGLMSAVIPGTGHFYTGRYRDGTLALLLNGAFLAAGIQAVANGHEAAAGLLLFFEAAWYSGAIYGAVNAAHKYNQDTEDRWRQGLERQHSPALRSLSRRSPSLVLVHIPF
jgi:outer membrane protein assembly factor BamD (BamD/ComL family)